MIQISPQMRLMVAVEAVDFRKGIDALVRICREELREDAFSGAVFIFRNRQGTSIRLLNYDGQGFWMCHKRLSSGRFGWWPKQSRGLEAYQLQVLLAGGNGEAVKGAPMWRRVS